MEEMKYQVDGWNNFCRVFRLPKEFPEEYCFGGGHLVWFQMIDWFNPVPDIGQPAVTKEVWRIKVGEIEVREIDGDDLQASLIPWLRMKTYTTPGTYLVLCDFGLAFTFTKEAS